MEKHEFELAAKLLDQASDRFGSDICNDWDFPAEWTLEQKQKFVKEAHEWNGDPEEYNPNFLHMPNFFVMGFLAAKLAKLGSPVVSPDADEQSVKAPKSPTR